MIDQSSPAQFLYRRYDRRRGVGMEGVMERSGNLLVTMRTCRLAATTDVEVAGGRF